MKEIAIESAKRKPTVQDGNANTRCIFKRHNNIASPVSNTKLTIAKSNQPSWK
jgi:hypothetical protein